MVDAESDPNRNPDGSFRRGNQAARRSGLFVRVGLTKGERNKLGRLRAELKAAGLPREMTAHLALQWLNATRVVEDYTRLRTPEQRAERFDIYERACRMMTQVLRLRERSMAPEDAGDRDLARALAEATRDAELDGLPPPDPQRDLFADREEDGSR